MHIVLFLPAVVAAGAQAASTSAPLWLPQGASSGSDGLCSSLWPRFPDGECDEGIPDEVWSSSSSEAGSSDSYGGSGSDGNNTGWWGGATGWCLRLAVRAVCHPQRGMDAKEFTHIAQHTCAKIDCVEIYRVRLPGLAVCPVAVQAAVLMSYEACFSTVCPHTSTYPMCPHGVAGPQGSCCLSQKLPPRWFLFTAVTCAVGAAALVMLRRRNRSYRRVRRRLVARIIPYVPRSVIEMQDAQGSVKCNVRVFSADEESECKERCPEDLDAVCDHTCAVCLERYQADEELGSSANCGHWFHRDCLMRAAARAPVCPLCKCSIVADPPPSDGDEREDGDAGCDEAASDDGRGAPPPLVPDTTCV
eukprot:TRINITY_DN20804_c0_g1_i1.p1 TRINITY_DN20804_c0_g1~~TRINITY_DN20804_c0_g1_i1.p1  ORF type:complete len:379 (+),score=89.11 TRINITY_DN20804_c0_g1_i1:55-1137(+)